MIFFNPQNMTIRRNYKFMETEHWRATFAQGDMVRWFPTRGQTHGLVHLQSNIAYIFISLVHICYEPCLSTL